MIFTAADTAEPAKLPYAKPTLTEAGSVADITFGGSVPFDFNDSHAYAGPSPS